MNRAHSPLQKWRLGVLKLVAVCLGLLLLGSVPGYSAEIGQLAFEDSGTVTRITLQANSKIEFVRPLSLGNPYRLIVDLRGVKPALDLGTGPGKGKIESYRLGQIGENSSRLVLALKAPMKLERLLAIPPVGHADHRYILDFVAVEPAVFEQNIRESLPRFAKPKESGDPSASAAEPKTSLRPLIILDPGHGGRDAGSLAVDQSLEKDIVLAFALELKRRLLLTDQVDVLMTRNEDKFVSLAGRIALARQAKADLFISLHADKLDNRRVSGASIYTLSDSATDQLAEAVAARENQAISLESQDIGTNFQPQVSDFLFDLMKRETRAFSENFADILTIALQTSTPLVNNARRSGKFHILTAPDIPSVLLELGFLSNREDTVRLQSEAWRTSTAEAVTVAILDFFARQRAL